MLRVHIARFLWDSLELLEGSGTTKRG